MNRQIYPVNEHVCLGKNEAPKACVQPISVSVDVGKHLPLAKLNDEIHQLAPDFRE